MSRVVSVRGYSKGEVSRLLLKRSRVNHDVLDVPSVAMEATIRFDRVHLNFDEIHKNRPYFSFTEGKIYAVKINDMRNLMPELNADTLEVHFPEGSRPDINAHWDLNEQELMQLIPKGLFGSDYFVDNGNTDPYGLPCPNRKPKNGEGIQFPSEYTEAFWELPIQSTLRMVMENDGLKPIPVVSVVPELDNGFIRTNSRISGYDNIAQYVPIKEYLNEQVTRDIGKYITIDDSIENVKPSAEPKPVEIPKKESVYLTPSEQVESEYRSKLLGNVAERIAAYNVSDDIDFNARAEHAVDVQEPILVDPYEDEALRSGDAFTIEELEDMGLIERYDDKPDVSYETAEVQPRTETKKSTKGSRRSKSSEELNHTAQTMMVGNQMLEKEADEEASDDYQA